MGQHSTQWPPTHGSLRLCVASGLHAGTFVAFPKVIVIRKPIGHSGSGQPSPALGDGSSHPVLTRSYRIIPDGTGKKFLSLKGQKRNPLY